MPRKADSLAGVGSAAPQGEQLRLKNLNVGGGEEAGAGCLGVGGPFLASPAHSGAIQVLHVKMSWERQGQTVAPLLGAGVPGCRSIQLFTTEINQGLV